MMGADTSLIWSDRLHAGHHLEVRRGVRGACVVLIDGVPVQTCLGPDAGRRAINYATEIVAHPERAHRLLELRALSGGAAA